MDFITADKGFTVHAPRMQIWMQKSQIKAGSRVTRWLGKNHPILEKVAKLVAKQNTAKLETIFKLLI